MHCFTFTVQQHTGKNNGDSKLNSGDFKLTVGVSACVRVLRLTGIPYIIDSPTLCKEVLFWTPDPQDNAITGINKSLTFSKYHINI